MYKFVNLRQTGCFLIDISSDMSVCIHEISDLYKVYRFPQTITACMDTCNIPNRRMKTYKQGTSYIGIRVHRKYLFFGRQIKKM